MNLRPYQQDCIDATMEGWSDSITKQLIVAPTGAGKAILMAKLAQTVLPKKTLMLCHREELISQAADKLRKATGIFAQIEKAEHRASLQSDVVVASVQTMQGKRLARWPQDHFGLVIADEAHHSISDSWQRTLQYFDKSAWVWGCTATPDRGDKKNLGKYFQRVAFEISLFDLINQGYLSRISVQSLPVQIDLSAVRQTAGDFNESDVGDALAPWLGAIAEQIKENASFRRTLIFLPLCATSRTMVEALQAVGLSAAHIDGNSPDRKEILSDFANGKYDVLCNAMLLTEGFDDPGIDCVVILRPTKSRALYSQMVGRGTRVAPAKSDLLLLDFLWLHEKHNLIRPAHLIASTQEQAEIMQKMFAAGGAKQEMLDLQGVASEAQVQREKKLQEELAAKAKKAAKTIDAMEFCLSLHVPDLGDYEPMSDYEARPVSDSQKRLLSNWGLDTDSVRCFGQASKMLDTLHFRAREGFATPKQVRLLKRWGIKDPHTVSYDAASRIISRRFGDNQSKANYKEKIRQQKQEPALAL